MAYVKITTSVLVCLIITNSFCEALKRHKREGEVEDTAGGGGDHAPDVVSPVGDAPQFAQEKSGGDDAQISPSAGDGNSESGGEGAAIAGDSNVKQSIGDSNRPTALADGGGTDCSGYGEACDKKGCCIDLSDPLDCITEDLETWTCAKEAENVA